MLVQQTAEPKTGRKPSRTALWVGIVVGVLFAAAIVDLIIVLRNWPFTERALAETLQKHANGPVRIGHFRETYFPPGCVAEDVQFPPGVTVQKFAVRGSYADLLTFHKHIDELRLSGVHVVFPPKSSDAGMPFGSGRSHDSSLSIGRAVVEKALLEFLPEQRGKQPYRIAIERLVVPHFSAEKAMPYDVALNISEPPGQVRSQGRFGPWKSHDPAQSPISGSFTYTHANLAVAHDITGFLDGDGKFDGTLGRINVHGSTTVPHFHIGHSTHDVRLTTEYDAVVNGMNGDTTLKRVQAHTLRTTGLFEGAVAAENGHPGKTLSLDMSVRDGRVEDLLLMFTRDKVASMDGAITLHGKATVPPGPRKFLEKLLINGDFTIAEAHFTKPSTQRPINRLSKSAEGEKEDQIDQDQRMMLSNVKAHVSTKNGVASLTNINFVVPGARARMAGTFNLETKMVELHGVLDTTGNISDSTSGFKSFLLKAITPFYKKKKKLTVIPFHIIGPIGHTTVGLDIGR